MFNPSAALFANTMLMFRLMFFHNKKPAEAGFIMYMTGAAQSWGDVNNIRQAMKSAKIPGNFRNLFMHSPSGKKDGIQIIPLDSSAAQPQFFHCLGGRKAPLMPGDPNHCADVLSALNC